MKVKDITSLIEAHAPIIIQEAFDNAGLVTGDPDQEISSVLVCLDLTEEVLDEALDLKAGLIVSHHPLIFGGLKNLLPTHAVNRILIKAIQKGISIYSAHTNLDKVVPGVSSVLADRIGLVNQQVLVPDSGQLFKLTSFVPFTAIDALTQALFDAGAGRLGNYDSCSFQIEGQGTFRALDGAEPFVGTAGVLHREPEVRVEVVVSAKWKSQVIRALLENHPYEEVAYDLIRLENTDSYQGLGILGELPEPVAEEAFLALLKKKLDLISLRHTKFTGKYIQKVALCGGSGSEFLGNAKKAGAQVYISGDFKYHQFFEAAGQILIADIGHFESEVFALSLIRDIVKKKFANFAVHLSKINTNPIKYY